MRVALQRCGGGGALSWRLVALGLGAVRRRRDCRSLRSQTIAGAAGGMVLGIALAFVVARALRGRLRARMQIAATILCAYGTYFCGDHLHLSGIFATIACGIALRYYERAWITLQHRRRRQPVLGPRRVAGKRAGFFHGGAGLEIGRLVCRAGLCRRFYRRRCRGARVSSGDAVAVWPYPREWIDVVRVAGMRGALSLALALAIPASRTYREAIIDATFAVSLATLAVGSFDARADRAASAGLR